MNMPVRPATIVATSPVRSTDLGLFTFCSSTSRLPAAFVGRAVSQNAPLPVFYPSTLSHHIQNPQRTQAMIVPSGFVPLSISVQYSTSVWRAMHPTAPPSLSASATQSQSHLPLGNAAHHFSYRGCYSHSSISLTRPTRLSTATPAASVEWSSRSDSTGPDDGRRSFTSGSEPKSRATPGQIAYAILNGTSIPGIEPSKLRPARHARHSSAPDASGRARHISHQTKACKHQSQSQTGSKVIYATELHRPSSFERLIRRASSAINVAVERSTLHTRPDMDMGRPTAANQLSTFKKTYSADPIRYIDTETPGQLSQASSVTGRLSLDINNTRMNCQDTTDGAQGSIHGQLTFEEIKNKPLPRISAL